ncbi:hypothetical protein CL628_00550 [bacterium]|nr:hypothetical protein [bacterium]
MAGPLTTQEVGEILAAHPQYSSIRVFIESGTELGRTIKNMRSLFSVRHTIELSPLFYVYARFKLFGQGIRFRFGDSARILPKIAARTTEPAVFFLDAHCSSGYTAGRDIPLYGELTAIAKRPYADLIIIDDVRLFGTKKKPQEDWSGITRQKLEKVFSSHKLTASYVSNDRLILVKEGRRGD